MATRNDGVLDLILGMTRCGKTSLMYERFKRQKRLIVMDRQAQLAALPGWDWKTAQTYPELRALVLEHLKSPEIAISYQPRSRADFNPFCSLAYLFGMAKPCTVAVDELAQYTGAGKGGEGWNALVNMALKYEINIIAAAQRAQEIDNTVRGAATNMFFFMQASEKDEKFIIDNYRGVTAEKFPREKFKYLWRKPDGKVSRHTTKKM